MWESAQPWIQVSLNSRPRTPKSRPGICNHDAAVWTATHPSTLRAMPYTRHPGPHTPCPQKKDIPTYDSTWSGSGGAAGRAIARQCVAHRRHRRSSLERDLCHRDLHNSFILVTVKRFGSTFFCRETLWRRCSTRSRGTMRRALRASQLP